MIKEPISQKTAARLEKMIIDDGAYKPGAQLPSERELADLLKISRPSLREAIKLLSSKGVLIVKHGVGTFVAENPGSVKDPLGVDAYNDKLQLLIDWFKVRMILEGQAMAMVVENATDAELLEIERILNKEVNLLATDADSEIFAADKEFHGALAMATHNTIMQKLIPTLHADVYYDILREFHVYGATRGIYYSSVKGYHNEIMNQLKTRDIEASITAMRYHMMKAIEDTLLQVTQR